MSASADAAIQFLQELSAVAERLASRDVVVLHLAADWGGFGSWLIEASQGDAEDRRGAAIRAKDYSAAGPEVVRVSWDGRDSVLDAGLLYNTVLEGGGKPEPILSQPCSSSGEALKVAERLLLDRLEPEGAGMYVLVA